MEQSDEDILQRYHSVISDPSCILCQTTALSTSEHHFMSQQDMSQFKEVLSAAMGVVAHITCPTI